jgi:hypothetical protein
MQTRHRVLLPLRLKLFVDLQMGGIGGCSGDAQQFPD